MKHIYHPDKIKIAAGAAKHAGGMLITVLVFTTIFAVTGLVLASLVNSQFKYSSRKVAWNRALQIAEAGANYYRWHLAHCPGDYCDAADVMNCGADCEGNAPYGPFVHDYNDPQGSTIGQFSLIITPPGECSDTVTIESTGWDNKFPSIQRKVKVSYGRPSLADFAFLTNSNVWFGDTEELHGPVHSNGGIRQDGTNDGVVTSAKETYICGPEHGCSGYPEKPGVWGSGGDQSLWDYPVSNVDFDSITADLSVLKNIATSTLCSLTEDCHWPQHGQGYHLEFLANGSFNLSRIKKLKNPVWGYNIDNWVREKDDIEEKFSPDNYTLPNNCAIIFIEDDLWIDGTINGNVTVVAARLPATGNSPKIVINGDLTYLAKDGSSTLGLISQTDILVPLYAAADDLEINGVLLAQNGRVYRKYYCRSTCCPSNKKVPANASSYILRDSLNLYGAIITNNVWTWSWVCGGPTVSGYVNTNMTYDPHLTYSPPPGFPTSGEYQYLTWEETTEK